MNSFTSPQIIEHLSANITFTPFETLWIPSSAKFIALGETPRREGSIALYEFDTDEKQSTPKLKESRKHVKPYGFKCGSFGASTINKRHLATGDFKGNLCIWYVICL